MKELVKELVSLVQDIHDDIRELKPMVAYALGQRSVEKETPYVPSRIVSLVKRVEKLDSLESHILIMELRQLVTSDDFKVCLMVAEHYRQGCGG